MSCFTAGIQPTLEISASDNQSMRGARPARPPVSFQSIYIAPVARVICSTSIGTSYAARSGLGETSRELRFGHFDPQHLQALRCSQAPSQCPLRDKTGPDGPETSSPIYPPVVEPTKKNFGNRFIQTALPGQLKGEARLLFASTRSRFEVGPLRSPPLATGQNPHYVREGTVCLRGTAKWWAVHTQTLHHG
jgi:hypothetical protein